MQPRRSERFAQASTWVGVAGVVLVLASLALVVYAATHGIHCVECDRAKIDASQLAWWRAIFDARFATLGIGALAGVAGAVAGERRWPGVVAIVLSFVGIGTITL